MKKIVRIGFYTITPLITTLIIYSAYTYYEYYQYKSSTHKPDSFEARHAANYYQNQFTGEILDRSDYVKFRDSLIAMCATLKSSDSLKREIHLTTTFSSLDSVDNLIVLPFKYSIRIGNEFLVRDKAYEKIGTNIPQKQFLTLYGENIQLGGKQTKPTVISLWFVGCTGCVQEMPVLNKLQEKYGDQVNFIAMTYDDEKRVSKFLKKTEFNYKHIVNAEYYIKVIGTQPYPENIFVSKDGEIKSIEGGLHETDSAGMAYYESLIEKLL